jgi:hypothetical protein
VKTAPLAAAAWAAVLLFLSLPGPRAWGQDTAKGPAPPWEASFRNPGEPRWAPLLRLRASEADYRDGAYWGSYLQLRAQAEAAAGNHAAALAFWDSLSAPVDSVGTLPAGVHATNALAYLGAMADTARILMINERHQAASDRLLTLELLPLLREKGFRYFAAETLNPKDTDLNSRAYPVDKSGVYMEPVFAAVVREARRLGYILVPYECTKEQREAKDDLTPQERRDHAEAQNLYQAIFKADPAAKVLVHAGFSHILEKQTEQWHPMALYLRDFTGIDAVTVDQTRLSERSAEGYEHPDYRAALAAGLLDHGPVVLLDSENRPCLPADFAVDVQVLTPPTTYAHGRPDWMSLGGLRKAVEAAVPECRDRWCFVEACVAGEPAEASPLDGTEIRDTDRAWLFVPPDEDIVIRVFGETGEPLATHPLPK